MLVCLPKTIADKLKEVFKSGDVPFDSLYDMRSKERHDLFAQYVSEEAATLINTKYDQAKLTGFKKAAADYVTASEKASFAKTATAGEFAKKLLSKEQVQKMEIKKIDDKLTDLQKKKEQTSIYIKHADGEDKANLEFKLQKLQDQEDRLNVRKEDLNNPSKDRMLKKINSLKDILSPESEQETYYDLARTRFGQDVTPAQGKYIVDKATELQKLREDNTAFSGFSDKYLEARNELNAYIDNLNPEHPGTSIIKNLIQIARNNLITNIATPLKTLVSGITNQRMATYLDAISSRSLSGKNPKIASEINKENWKTFRKTGMNTAAMDSIDDNSSVMASHTPSKDKSIRGTSTTNETFETPKSPASKIGNNILEKIDTGVGKVAKLSHHIAITLEHNIPFVKIYGKAFSDSLNFRSGDIAKLEGLKGDEAKARAEELMRDAARIEPQTDEGRILRKESQELAARILNVNNTFASRFSVGIKNAFNKIVPGVPIGDLMVPIAKIPANIIANGINNTPLGIPHALWDIVKGKANIGSDDLQTRYEGMMQYRNGIRQAIRIVGSVAVASYIVSQLDPKDFRSDNYGNHFLKIGNTWINTEYIASISPNIAGMMAVRQGKGGLISNYASGLLHIPGVNEATNAISSITKGTAIKDVGAQVKSRAIPQGIQNMFKDRPINRLFFGATGVESEQQVKADDDARAAKAKASKKASGLKGPSLKGPKI